MKLGDSDVAYIGASYFVIPAYGEHKYLIFLLFPVGIAYSFYFPLFSYFSFKVHLQLFSGVLNIAQVSNM
jgi:hypothetical protein